MHPLSSSSISGSKNAKQEPSPGDFRIFISELIADHLNDPNSSKRVDTEVFAHLEILIGLSNYFFRGFPAPEAGKSWFDHADRISVIHLGLDYTQRVLRRVDGIFQFEEENNPSRFLFAALICLEYRVGHWIPLWDASEPMVPLTGGKAPLVGPVELKQRARETLTTLFNMLSSPLSRPEKPSLVDPWKSLSAIVDETVAICQELPDLVVSWDFPIEVVIFQQPRIIHSTQGSWSVTIDHASDVPLFLSDLIDLVLGAFSVTWPLRWLYFDSINRILECSASTFNTIVSRSSTVSLKRLQALLQILQAIHALPAQVLDYHSMFSQMLHSLLRFRLHIASPSPSFNDVDASLIKLCAGSAPKKRLKDLVPFFAQHLTSEPIQNKSLALSCFESLVTGLDRSQVPPLNSIFRNCKDVQALDIVSKITWDSSMDVDVASFQPTHWRKKTRLLLEDILHPEDVGWMEDEDTFADEIYVYRVLEEIHTHFTRPRDRMASDKLIGLSQSLSKLLCLVSGCSNGQCFRRAFSRDLACLSVFLPIFVEILQDHQEADTNSVRRAVYQALRHAIQHHPCDAIQAEDMDSILTLAWTGLSDKDRGVRLSAGSSFVAVCTTLSHNGPTGAVSSAKIFDTLLDFCDDAVLPVKETLLIVVGSVGKHVDGEVLGHALSFLSQQLSRVNIILKGSSYGQMLAIAEHQKKKIYPLLLPYLPTIAPLLVTKICSQPGLLVEFCRLIYVAPKDFMSTTLPHTLPQVFASREETVLRKLSTDVDRSIPSLFQRHSKEILAAIFLLDTQAKTNQSLKFLVDILRKESQKPDINTENVVRVSLVQLLAELVVATGHELEKKKEQGLNALRKVESVIGNNPGRGRAVTKGLAGFLKQYMLGIITNINDLLQDVHGKKNVRTKQQIIRSLGVLIHQVGPDMSNVAPQILATFQTTIPIPELSEVTLLSWYRFLTTLAAADLGAHVGPTSAAIVSVWPTLSPSATILAKQCLEHIVLDIRKQLPGSTEDEIADLSGIPELKRASEALTNDRSVWNPKERLDRILTRSSSDNATVAAQALGELHFHMLSTYRNYVRELATGDVFDSLIGKILISLFASANRDGEGSEKVKSLALQCLSVLGAVDPDRCEVLVADQPFIVLKNFTDEDESIAFAIHLISDLLVVVFRSTSDTRYQSHLAYTIQELLRYCKFSIAVIGKGSIVPSKVRHRWHGLSGRVVEIVTPFLDSHFTIDDSRQNKYPHPIYSSQTTYREWIQMWTSFLISRVYSSGNKTAQDIFGTFKSCIRNKDVTVARHLLPHLILTVLVSGSAEDIGKIHEELTAVLKDQVDTSSNSTPDKRFLSAQAVFNLLDHLNEWLRKARQNVRLFHGLNEHLTIVDSVLLNINEVLMARAALQCKSYPRALMTFEQQIVKLHGCAPDNRDLPDYYERMHEIYAHLDEPDGMEGISALILAPSLEHQIRQHESTGRWTSAQSCWEVRLQQSPNNVEFHIGLLRCLRNLGHYDTLRTHVQGVLIRNPEWESALAGFYVESAWMIGAWDEVQAIVNRATIETSQITLARLLLAVRNDLNGDLSADFSIARAQLGAPILAAGNKAIYRSYDAMLDLHLVQDLELVHSAVSDATAEGRSQLRKAQLTDLTTTLQLRMDSTLPTFRTREPILSMRRTALGLIAGTNPSVTRELGRTWLTSAKIARTAAQWQTAYSAMLQARQSKTRFSFVQSAKLLKATGEPLRALQELENSMRQLGLIEKSSSRTPSNSRPVIDLTEDKENNSLKARAHILRARWMHESQRYDPSSIVSAFDRGMELQKLWEGAHFYFGKFYDDCFKELPSGDKQSSRGARMNTATIKMYTEALKCGSKQVYQTVPRLLTIWLDWGESYNDSTLKEYNNIMKRALHDIPVYKWYTAFPQIVSRIEHSRASVYTILSEMIIKVLMTYPEQGLWSFISTVKSKHQRRRDRGADIFNKIRAKNPRDSKVSILVNESMAMAEGLLNLCDFQVSQADPTLKMAQFPTLERLGKCHLIIPLQQSMTASLPASTNTSDTLHKPFPNNLPTFYRFHDDIEVMKSLAKPRKITITGSDGKIYMFLGKPKDDLRKDARLMDFNGMINKLLRAKSESRRRRLHIRTYGVVTLNEECGLIQWVPNTLPLRHILSRYYKALKIDPYAFRRQFNEMHKMVKTGGDPRQIRDIFVNQVLPDVPPVFKDWFKEMFPEPKAWFNARLSYGRTLAVMSMVGFILGLGDRHCENILLDTNSADIVHVDLNCLFEKGRDMDLPERIPFRLTQNLIDGLGITGVEGVFRISSEVTIQLLKDNKDSLMSVLDAFVHDPLVEWQDMKDKAERENRKHQGQGSFAKLPTDIAQLARQNLGKISQKLKGVYIPYTAADPKNKKGEVGTKKPKEHELKQHSTGNLVQVLIQEATSETHLARMYIGWAPQM